MSKKTLIVLLAVMAAIVIAFVALFIPLNKRKTELETQLAEQTAETERITQQNESLTQQLNEKTEQAETLEADLEACTGEIGTLTAEKDLLQTTLEEVNTQNTALQTSLEAKTTENASLMTELETVNAARATESAHLDALQADLDALQVNRDALQANRDALQVNRDALQVELDALQANRDALQVELDTYVTKSLLDDSKLKVQTSIIEDLEQKRAEEMAAGVNETDDDAATLVWSDGKNDLCRYLTAQLKRYGFVYDCSWSDEYNCDLVRIGFDSMEIGCEVFYDCWVYEDTVCIRTENLPLLVKELEKEEIIKCNELNNHSPITRFTVENGRLVASFQFMMSVGKNCGEDMVKNLFCVYWDIEEAWKAMRTYERTHP